MPNINIGSALSRYRSVLVYSCFYLIIAVLLRLTLWLFFGMGSGVAVWDLPAIIALGFCSDLLTLTYITAPFVILLSIWPQRRRTTKFGTIASSAFFFCLIYALIYLCAAEFFFFDEFNSRFNLVAVDYLFYPHEVFVNIWESYPVVWFLIATFILSSFIFRLMRPWLTGPKQVELPMASRAWLPAFQVLVLLPLILRSGTDEILFFNNRISNEIANNGISGFFRALRTEELDYNTFYRTIPLGQAFRIVRQELQNSGVKPLAESEFDLQHTYPASAGLGKMNVIIVSEESFGAGFIGTYGDKRGLSPKFDNLATQGLLFENAFATGTRTVRGLEAITASFPPIPSESIIRRPGSDHISNWGSVMNKLGYHSSFVYGGFSMFDDMQKFYAGNGFEVVDRMDIKEQTFSNIWGVCDHDLFRHASKYYDQISASGQPFFSIIMTTSNHKPYTFPDGIPGVPAKGGGRDAGIKYADYALDEFLRDAKGHSWFENTLFVVVADHDARVFGRAQVPVERYRIPLLLYAPGKILPRRDPTLISQIDILPTVMGILGLEFSGPFYGENVLLNPNRRRPILLNHNHDVALYNGERLVVLGLNKSSQTYRYDVRNGEQTPIEADQDLLDLATAYYQTAFELFSKGRY